MMVSFRACRVYKSISTARPDVVKIILLVLLFQILTQASGKFLYVSKAHGHDGTNSCQNMASPCGTLDYVINMTSGNDVIMLDGSHTDKIPYDTCPTKPITKKLSLHSWNGIAIINCSGKGLNFYGTVEFHGLKFLDTFLKVNDVSLTINDCSFGSFQQNTIFLYLIDVSVTKSQGNLRINITNTNFLEKNNAGTLSVVNEQGVSVFVEISNINVIKNFLEKTNVVISIQGYVNFNFMNSEVSNTKFSEKISNSFTSLVYFSGCLDANTNEGVPGKSDSTLGGKAESLKHGRLGINEQSRPPTFDQNSTIITFSLRGINFSSNHAGIIQAVFCGIVDASITNTTVFNNIDNNRTPFGPVYIKTKGGILGVLVTNCSFVSNVKKGTGPMITVFSPNLTMSVTYCNFSHNQAGAVYVATRRSSVISIRNSVIQFSKSHRILVSYCGAQICVIFRNPDDSWVNAGREDSPNCPVRGRKRSGKLGRGAPLEAKEGASLTGTNMDGHTYFLNMNGSLAIDRSGKLWKGGSPESKDGALRDDDKTLESTKKRHGFDPKRGQPLKLPTVHPLEHEETFDLGLLIEDCEFYNNTGVYSRSAVLELHSSEEQSISQNGESLAHVQLVQVRRCTFVGNTADDNGVIYVAANIGCNISDSTFFYNNGVYGSGAIGFTGSIMFLQNCTLDSNNGGSVRYTQATGSMSLTNNGTAVIQDSRIIQRNTVHRVSKDEYHSTLAISSDLFYKFVLSNSTLDFRWAPSLEKVIVIEIAHTSKFVLEQGTSIQCPRGYMIKYSTKGSMNRSISPVAQSFECVLCTMGSYTIDRGVYRDNSSNLVECLLCPYGGRCKKGLEALPNFWGYKIKNNPPTIQFSRCPMGYCCQASSSQKGCIPYDTCNSDRHGRLCGACKPGYTETLFTPSCRKSEKCTDYWFWPMGIIFVLGFTLYLIIQPDIPGILHRSITWFRPTQPQVSDPDETQDFSDETSGLERIVFFYYQAINILSVQGSYNTIWENHLTQFILGLFNFDMRLNREGFACPFPGLNPVSKVLLHSLGVFSVLFAIPCLFLLHKAMSVCFPGHSPKNGIYLSAFLKSVFLGYTVLAQKSLTLLKCIVVDGANCLFVNCNIECYTWWQTLIGTLVLIYFFPFVLVIFFGAKKLYKKQISVAHFFLACLFPLPLLSYWFLNRRHLGGQIVADTRGRTAITSVLIGSYRVPDHISVGAIYWESVLIGRILVLILAGVLISDPFLSSLTLLLLCIINLSMHIYVCPYERVLDNRAEIISLFSLILIAMFNLPFMAYVSEGVVPTGPMSHFIDVFMWCQVVLVGFLPLICVLLVLIAIFSQASRLVFIIAKGVRFACACCFTFCRCFGESRTQNELDDPLME